MMLKKDLIHQINDDECERPLAKEKNKKLIGKVKADDGGSDKKAKGT